MKNTKGIKILIIDGQGGGLGKNLISRIKKEEAFSACEIIAVGTNSIATSAMLKAGANYGATGENAVIYNCQYADIVLGAIGIAFANSMFGEISPKMAAAVSESSAYKLLVPISKCNVGVAGVSEKPMLHYIDDLISELYKFCAFSFKNS